MDQHQPQQSQNLVGRLKTNFNVLHAVARVVSFPVVLVTTRLGTWGPKFVGPAEAVGLVWPLGFAAFFAGDRAAGTVYAFWYVTLGLFALHQSAGAKKRREGYRCHSQFWGHSWREREDRLAHRRHARFGDSILALMAGVLLHAAGQRPLGALLALGAVGKLFVEAVEFRAVAARVRRMEDARIENETYVDLYREREPEITGEN